MDDVSILKIALDLEERGKKKQGPTKEDLEEASGRGDRENWFEEGICPKSNKVERGSASNCKRNCLNPAVPAKGTTPNKN